MIKILFVCHGNICRSPAAEFIMKDLVQKQGRAAEFEIASAAVSSEEIWNGVGGPVYPPMREELRRLGIGTKGNELGVAEKQAEKLTREMYFEYDLLIGMDRQNMVRMKKICGNDPEGKMSLLMDHTETPGDVEDPWYTRDFAGVCRQITRGCEALLKEIG